MGGYLSFIFPSDTRVSGLESASMFSWLVGAPGFVPSSEASIEFAMGGGQPQRNDETDAGDAAESGMSVSGGAISQAGGGVSTEAFSGVGHVLGSSSNPAGSSWSLSIPGIASTPASKVSARKAAAAAAE